jgi:hypothetical protein
MIKHVGKHNGKKIVVLWRKVPNESHMALVTYSDTLPRLIHDEVMKQLESAIGQNAKEFSDVLFRTVMADGRNALEVMHREGFIKKVPTSQILVTPTSKSSVRLDELNSILDEMEQGEEAIKRLQDIDTSAGLQTPKKKVREGREVGMPPNNSSVSRTNVDVDANSNAASYAKGTLSEGVLTDEALAAQRIEQAIKMQQQAEQLLAEAKRLTEEAQQFSPAKNVKTTRAKKATPTKKQAS